MRPDLPTVRLGGPLGEIQTVEKPNVRSCGATLGGMGLHGRYWPPLPILYDTHWIWEVFRAPYLVSFLPERTGLSGFYSDVRTFANRKNRWTDLDPSFQPSVSKNPRQVERRN